MDMILLIGEVDCFELELFSRNILIFIMKNIKVK